MNFIQWRFIIQIPSFHSKDNMQIKKPLLEVAPTTLAQRTQQTNN